MIRQEIYIKEHDWHITAFYAVDCYYVGEITERLKDLGCSGSFMRRAVRNMKSCKLNQGLCYSNQNTHESVLVTSLTSDASQFLNSLTHELHHLVCHICEGVGIDLTSEEAAYLTGNIAQEIYPKVVSLLCEHCRSR